MIHDIFQCKLYMCKCFTRMLNSRVIKFVNVSENKVLANNSECTVPTLLVSLPPLSLVTRKPVFGVCNQEDTNWSAELMRLDRS